MATQTKTILLAGYGWFSGIPEGETNNAELIARALDGEIIKAYDEQGEVIAQGVVRSVIVPVIWDEAFDHVLAAVRAHQPDIVLGMGTDARAGGMRMEPYGVNWQRGRDAHPLDPNLITEKDGPILPGGEDAIRGTLPYEDMVIAMLQSGVPATLGGLTPPREDIPLPALCTAGTYLCNQQAYLLGKLGRETGIRAGFLHAPTQPAYAAARRLKRITEASPEEREDALRRPISAMPLDMMIRAARAALAACLRTA